MERFDHLMKDTYWQNSLLQIDKSISKLKKVTKNINRLELANLRYGGSIKHEREMTLTDFDHISTKDGFFATLGQYNAINSYRFKGFKKADQSISQQNSPKHMQHFTTEQKIFALGKKT